MLGVCMREVRFGYTDRKILDSISFRAEQGKLLCVLGRNGVGKTTLFQLLLGSLKGYEGRIEVNGKSLEEYEEKGNLPNRSPIFPRAIIQPITIRCRIWC